MKQEYDTTAPATACEYLADHHREMKRTEVYVQTQVTTDIWSVEAAMRYMRDQLPQPLPLRKVSSDGLTVILEASAQPQIRIGRSLPRNNPTEDIQEILSVLKSHGIHGELRS